MGKKLRSVRYLRMKSDRSFLDFEVLKDVSKNFATVENEELGWIGEGEAGTLVTNCCDIVL